jgi:ATP-dependent Clp protease protease subunit
MNNAGASVTKKNDDLLSGEERIEKRLLDNSIHFLTGEIAEENITACIKWIVFENIEKRQDKTLTLYINSTGGDLYQAFGLIDIMQHSSIPIRTIGIGSIMSAAFLIFASGTRGARYIAPNTGIMCHQFSDELDNKYHDIKAQMKEADLCNDRMLKILTDATGKSVSAIKKTLLAPSDNYMTANEAINIGIADFIL